MSTSRRGSRRRCRARSVHLHNWSCPISKVHSSMHSVLLLCHGAALKCAPAPLCCGCLPLGASTLTTGVALQVGQNSQFSEGFDPSVYAAARADLQARKAAKAKAHTGAGGRTTHPQSGLVFVSVGLVPTF